MSSIRDAIQICRVYTPPKTKKGTWILVDRLWPRGLKKEKLDFDLWLKEITPSPELRKWYHGDNQNRWEDFAYHYIEELKTKGPLIEDVLDMAKKAPVTLFYAAKDTKQNHAIVLREVLCSWPKLPESDLFLHS